MNGEETSRVLAMISTHYWQTTNLAGRNVDLMVETWTQALADIPLTPYIENALDWWFKHEKWPPQAAELRERAKTQMRNQRKARESAELLQRYSPIPERVRPNWEERGKLLARLVAGEITAHDLDTELARVDGRGEGSDT